MNKKKLYILADECPYGTGEDTFILPEIEILKRKFDIILISSVPKELAVRRELPKWCADIEILRFCVQEENRIIFYKYFLRFWTKKACLSEIKEILKTRRKVFLRIWKSMHFYARAEILYHWIKKNDIIDQKNGIYYSYWYYDKVLAMALHRNEYPELKIVARAHRYDLFDEAVEKTLRQPFKKFMDSQIDYIMFVSRYNRDYYVRKVGESNLSKYLLQRIGAPKAKDFPEEVNRKDIFRLVSCSNIIKVKRVSLIVDALRYIEDIQMEWIHFGSGSEAKDVQEYAQSLLKDKKNIRICFKGYTPRDEIYKYYSSAYVHCFINVSESEGSPVSIQEALAFGMPVIGTDVGGVSEMIDGNGYLLNADPSAEEVAGVIRKIYSLNETEYHAMRKKSLELWNSEYSLDRNMSDVAKFFEKL